MTAGPAESVRAAFGDAVMVAQNVEDAALGQPRRGSCRFAEPRRPAKRHHGLRSRTLGHYSEQAEHEVEGMVERLQNGKVPTENLSRCRMVSASCAVVNAAAGSTITRTGCQVRANMGSTKMNADDR